MDTLSEEKIERSAGWYKQSENRKTRGRLSNMINLKQNKLTGYCEEKTTWNKREITYSFSHSGSNNEHTRWQWIK